MENTLTWMHVSDIHFGQGQGERVRVDQGIICRKIIEDARTLGKQLGPPDLVLVTGDIAFKADPEEYRSAADWLDKLLEAVNADSDRLFLVPGNHDVNRGAVSTSPTAKILHQALRQDSKKLDNFIANPKEVAPLWAKLSAYSEFAKNYGAPSITASQPFWTGDKYSGLGELTLAGLNTCLISFDNDDAPGNLALSLHQLKQAIDDQDSERLLLVLQHHPLNWLADGKDLERMLQGRAHILFCGHIHEQGGLVASPLHGGGILALVAGAGHNDPDQAPEHAYAWGQLDAAGLAYFPRTWVQELHRFRADHNRFAGMDSQGAVWIPAEQLPPPLKDWLQRPRTPLKPPSRPLPPVKPGRQIQENRVELSVRLVRRKDQLERSLYDHVQYLAGNATDWSQVAPVLTRWQQEGEQASRKPAWTDTLYQTLFGHDAADLSAKIFPRLSGNPADRATQCPVRLRLYIEDPELNALPWQATTFQGERLVENEWTFELLDRDPDTRAPDDQYVTFYLPSASVMVKGDSQWSDLSLCMQKAWAAIDLPPPLVIQAWRDPARASVVPVTLFYVIVRFQGKKRPMLAGLARDGQKKQPVPLAQLARTLSHWSPIADHAMLFLNLVTDKPPGIQVAMSRLLERFSLVLTQWAPESQIPDLQRTATDWCAAIARGASPVAAFNRCCLPSGRVWGRYQTIEMRVADRGDTIRIDLALLLLDRAEQRNALHNCCHTTFNHAAERIFGVVAYGAAHAQIHDFPRQLAYTLPEHVPDSIRDQTEVLDLRIKLPPEPLTVEGLALAMHRTAGLDPVETMLGEVIECLTAEPLARGHRRLWVLHFLREGGPLKMDEVTTWARFCDQELARVCPKNVRIVAMLTVETTDDEQVEATVQTLHQTHNERRFQILMIPALSHINQAHLTEFLRIERIGCPHELQTSLPHLIMQETQGQFDDTVRLLEGYHGRWYDLHERLVQKYKPQE